MKTIEEIVKFGNEGYKFRDVIDNLTDEQIKDCFKEYTEQFIDSAVRFTFHWETADEIAERILQLRSYLQ